MIELIFGFVVRLLISLGVPKEMIKILLHPATGANLLITLIYGYINVIDTMFQYNPQHTFNLCLIDMPHAARAEYSS